MRVLAIVALGAAGSCSHTEHVGPEVESFKIEGNESLSSSHIKSKIVTEATGWWPFASRKDYDPVTWDKDRARVERLYASEGFYQAKVKASRVPVEKARDPNAKVEVKMEVDEGPRATVEKLRLEGLEGLPENRQQALQKRLPLKEAEPFTEGEWQKTKGILDSRLRDTGHAEAQVEGRAMVDLASNKVDATVWVQPGPVYSFGDIVVEQGTPSIKPLWIEEQVRLAAPLGEVFTPEAVTEAQRRVFTMNVFTQADVELGQPDPQTQRVPLIVKTQTAPYHLLRLGGGAGFDQVRNEVRVLGEWTDNNFLGGLRTLRLRSRLGWAFIPNAYSNITGGSDPSLRNGAIGLLRADFEQPRLFEAPAWKFAHHIEGERQLQEAFTATSGRSGPDLIWQLRSDLRISVGYELEGWYIEPLAIISPLQSLLVSGCKIPEMRMPGEKIDACTTLISSLHQRITFDRRDDPMEPRRGFYVDAQLQEAGGPLSDFTYLRAIGDVRGYISFGRITFAGRAQLGGLFPTSGVPADTPIQHRLYAGGGMSMRGFGYRRLSPLLAVPIKKKDGSTRLATVVIGGNGLFVSNLETRFKITSNFLLAAFYDTGAVTESSDTLVNTRLFHAVGGGVRILTPVGSIRLDIARRFANGAQRSVNYGVDQVGDGPLTENTSCFGFGGGNTQLSDGLCQIHLSIGEAF